MKHWRIVYQGPITVIKIWLISTYNKKGAIEAEKFVSNHHLILNKIINARDKITEQMNKLCFLK